MKSMTHRIMTACILQVLLTAAVFGSVFFDHAFGCQFSPLVCLFGIVGCAAIVVKAGEKRSRYLLLILTIPVTIYAFLLGMLFNGEGI